MNQQTIWESLVEPGLTDMLAEGDGLTDLLDEGDGFTDLLAEDVEGTGLTELLEEASISEEDEEVVPTLTEMLRQPRR